MTTPEIFISDGSHSGSSTAVGIDGSPSPHAACDAEIERLKGSIRVLMQQEHRSEPDGAARIAAERSRQIKAEGWTPGHDAHHDHHELITAGVTYALAATGRLDADGQPKWTISAWWPRGWEFKAADPVTMLTKAGALIAAEIDRLLAAAVPCTCPDECDREHE